MIRRRQMLASLAGIGTVGLSGCSSDGSTDGDADGGGDDGSDGGSEEDSDTDGADGSDSGTGSGTMSAAWVYVGLIDDLGWTQQHDKGRQHVEEKFDWLETSFVEEVAEDNSGRVFEELSQENDLVFGTSFGYLDAMLDVSSQHPDVAYEHCSGVELGENMGLYYGKMAQARYLVGYAAGLVTETDTVGFSAAFDIPAVLREMNGFAAGLMASNPDASILIRWTNAWFDPQKSQEAAESLIDEGADVLAQVQDSPAVVRTARDNGVWGTGSNAPMDEFGGDTYLTTGIWSWDTYYEDVVKQVRNGSWEPEFSFPGYPEGVVDIDEFGPQVPEDVKTEVREQEAELEVGALDIWEGTKFADVSPRDQYYEMSELLENFDSDLPG